LRLAETTSAVGAGVLGLGLGVVLAAYLRKVGWPVLLTGLLAHTWGMTDKRRLESANGSPRLWWATSLYWFCWLCIIAIVAYVIGTQL
jgi:hypothetical protein